MHELPWTLLICAAGLALLFAGGELLVRSASSLAAAARVAPLAIGSTVVAFGTSAPELAVSVRSALGGEGTIALGNVVGSNIFNVLFILGASALIVPLAVATRVVRWDVPWMIATSVAVLVLGWDGRVGRIEGCLLVASLGPYAWWSFRESRREPDSVQSELARALPEPATTARRVAAQIGLLLLGLAVLNVGARLLVDGAVSLAQELGVGELVIGLTIVAVGTSLPEVATSIVAAVRGERDIAVGNVVGSNIFNLLGVLGLSSVVAPDGVPLGDEALRIDVPIMVAVAFACLPIVFTGHRIARWEGGVLLFYYAAYVAYRVLAATGRAADAAALVALLAFVVPLTVLTLAVTTVRSFRAGRRSRS